MRLHEQGLLSAWWWEEGAREKGWWRWKGRRDTVSGNRQGSGMQEEIQSSVEWGQEGKQGSKSSGDMN